MSRTGEDFSALLKSERERLGLSQQQAADMVGVRREMWGKYERGAAEPGVGVILKFCEGGGDPVYLFNGCQNAHQRAAQLLYERFKEFESHELEMRDNQDQLGSVMPPELPTRENVLEQFCGLYNKFGPIGVGLPEWIITIYPMVNPDLITAALKRHAEAPAERREWIIVPPQDWSAWMATVAELVANGVAPGDVLACFRPSTSRNPNPVPSPDTDTTNLMF